MPKTRKIYLDYAAGMEANPSSIHSFGVNAKKKLEIARKEVAHILGARQSEIIFTSGGTESNNLAIQGVVLAWQGKGLPHIITTNIEHPSVLETCKLLEKRKLAQISIVPVEANGIVDSKKIKKEIKNNTILISVMYANNEIGTIQPIREIAKEIRHYKKTHLTQPHPSLTSELGSQSQTQPLKGEGANSTLSFQERVRERFPIFHTDAVQAVNYLELNVEKLGVDLLSLSGSKVEEAGKVGVLYKRKGTPISNIFGGGDQEFGLRPGTENVALSVGFAKALQITEKIKEKEVKRLTKLRDYFFDKIFRNTYNSAIAENLVNSEIILNGDLKNRLPNNINITIPNIPSDLLVIELSARGIMASAKSACKSGDGKVSHVLKAIHPEAKETDLSRRSNAEEDGSLRFSLGRQTTKSDINYTVKALSEILTKLKKWYA